jgi:hypothetical protein
MLLHLFQFFYLIRLILTIVESFGIILGISEISVIIGNFGGACIVVSEIFDQVESRNKGTVVLEHVGH